MLTVFLLKPKELQCTPNVHMCVLNSTTDENALLLDHTFCTWKCAYQKLSWFQIPEFYLYEDFLHSLLLAKVMGTSRCVSPGHSPESGCDRPVASLVMMNRSLLSSAFSCWAEEMAQKAKALFNKSKNLSVILGTHGVDGEASPCLLSSDLHMCPGPSSSCTVTDCEKMKMQQKSFPWMCQGFILSQNQNQMPYSEWNLKE